MSVADDAHAVDGDNRIARLQAAAATRTPAPEPAISAPTPWGGAAGGDARLCAVVPMFRAVGGSISWASVSTHVPGRSGRECRERWLLLDG